MGISKLALNGMITDQNVSQSELLPTILGSLVSCQAVRKLMEMYVSPKTASNQELRQALTFSLPVYSYSSLQNQLTIVRVRTTLLF
jgi:condensin complex subunit 3